MLNKNSVNINFGQGLDTKTDPKQVSIGKFLRLQNSIFTKAGLLQKRNGFGTLAALPNTSSILATTFNGNLTAIGSSFNAYSNASSSWVNRGTFIPLQMNTLPLIRSNLNQTQADAAVSPNGLVCTAYTEIGGSPSPNYKYVVADATTGQNIIVPTVIPGAGVTGSPKVFVLGSYFIIVFTNVISATPHLQFIAVNFVTLTVTSPADISTTYTPATTVNFDGVVSNNKLFIAWNGSDGGGAIRIRSINTTLTLATTVVFTGHAATIMTVTADESASTSVIYVSFYNSATSTGYTLAINQNLSTILAQTQIISSGTVLNITSAANNGVCTIFYEVSTVYSYDGTIATNIIDSKTITQSGTVGSAVTTARSLGLASKAFTINGVMYFLGVYNSVFQPTYFLMNSSANVVARLAYQNGGNYCTLGLPSVSVTGTTAQFAYFYKDLISAVNTTQGAPNAAGVYSQTGINLATIEIGSGPIITAEIGNNLNLTGGFLWMYDGYSPVEQNFFLYPENVEIVGSTTSGNMIPQQYFYQFTYEWSDNQGNVFRSAPSIPISFTIDTAPANFTGNITSGSPVVPSVSSTANLQVGQAISGTGIPSSTFILSIDSSTQITMTKNATSGSSTSTTITPLSLTAVTLNVPTLRLTYKTANPVKIVAYRWSAAQESYFQVTSITAPVLNSTTSDSVAITDTLADTAIIGNNLIYTTGGVVEDIGPPSFTTMALFKSRLVGVTSEDQNLLWYSKQVIESTPVEMSDLFTIYVAPTTSAQGTTGPITALSAMDDKLIIFKKDAIYYITGTGPDNTGINNDFSDPTFITSTVGCVNQSSIVFIPAGLMFQSDKGIWLLGRDLSTTYIGAPVEEFNGYAVDSALNIPGTNQVRFSMEQAGVTLMYDYYFGQWGTFVGIPAISSTLYQGLHTYINSFGQVFQETQGAYLDGSSPVLMSFTTGWINIANLQGYERFYYFYLLGNFISPHKLVVELAYDYAPQASQQTIITPYNYNAPWGGDATWGSSTPWGGTSSLEQWKVHAQRQTCQAFQVSINEIFDPSFKTVAGAGLTLSGINATVGVKRATRPIGPRQSVG